MNQAEAAAVLGCSEAHISRLVSGERMPSTELVIRIEREFRWPVLAQLRAGGDGTYGEELKNRIDRVVRRA